MIGLATTSTLTDRQLEVLRQVLVSASVKVAAEALGISIWTVREHVAEARRRTGSETRDQLVAWCDDHVAGWRERRSAA
jgi:DNA-binding CsgD family transcriptional regulator